MDDKKAIERYNAKRKARITKRANADWRDGGTLNEYEYKQPEAQSYVINPSSAPRKTMSPKEMQEEACRRLNSFRRRGNFGQLHAEIEGMPLGCAISYGGNDWVKGEGEWRAADTKPLRDMEFTRKLLQDGKDVEYDPNGKKKASKNAENKIRELWKNGQRGAMNSFLESCGEGSTLTIDGCEYRKDGYRKWECDGNKYGSRGITERIDKANGKFRFGY